MACAISAVLSGLVYPIQTDGHSIILSLPLRCGPGLVFGCCFSLVHLRGAFRTVLYIVVSGLIYFGAVRTTFDVGTMLGGFTGAGVMPNLLAGLLGGLSLAILTKLLTGTPLTLYDEVGAAVLGALTGAIFLYPFMVPVLGGVLAFASWQIPVGWWLAASLKRQREASEVVSGETVGQEG